MLAVLREAPGGVPADLQQVVNDMQAWSDQGAHRRDRNKDNHYDDAGAVMLMDAWWPKALDAAFRPALGDDLFNRLRGAIGFDDDPREQGSAYQAGWYGYMQKDLRNMLGRPITAPYSRAYCGGGSLAQCSAALADSLRAALAVPYNQLYPGTGGSAPGCLDSAGGDAQMCRDAVHFQAVGGLGVHDIHWINRPTFQQAIEIFRHRERPAGPAGPGGGPGPGGGSSTRPGAGRPGAKNKALKKCRKARKKARRKGKKPRRCKRKKHKPRRGKPGAR
jgi:hypothetical protein